MKKLANLIVLATFLGGLMSLWLFVEAKAQINFFTFFIPYPADQLDDQFDEGRPDPPAGLDLLNDIISTTISISINEDNTIIYYDHWEDQLESNLTTPAQNSTQVWGDSNNANGIPPGFTNDELNSGDVIVLRNPVPTPRDPNLILFDGGDKFTADGGPVAITLTVWPVDDDTIPPPVPPEPGILYAGAWELYPTNKWGLEYLIPIGQDIASRPPGERRDGFLITGISVQATQDGTSVELDLNADNNPDGPPVTLNEGDDFTQVSGVNSGAHIIASAPVQVHIFTTDPNRSYEARAYSITPVDQWSDQLLAPRSAEGDFWLYNRHNSTLTLTVRSITGTNVLTIPAQSADNYPATGLIDPAGTIGTGLHFASTDGRDFYGVAALDQNENQDWGYAVLPVDALTTQTLVGWGIGNNNNPPGPNPIGTGYESLIYVTALNDTIIFADFDNDGTPDASFNVTALQETPITKTVDIPPGKQYDLTGTFLYTQDDTRFLAVWGQDEGALAAEPSIDVGTSIVPFPSLLVQKTVDPLLKDLDCTGTTTVGDVIEYQIKYFNTGVNQINNVFLRDLLPSEVKYITETTKTNGNPVPDDSGSNPFPLDEGGYSVGTIGGRSSGLLTFEATVTNLNFPSNLIINRTVISSTDISITSDFALIFTPVTSATETIYQIANILTDPVGGAVFGGQTITLSLTITNTGALDITSFPLQYLFDDSFLTFDSATPAPSSVNAGVISWADLTAIFGNLLPGTPVSLTVSFVVNDNIPGNVNSTIVEAIGTGGTFSDGSQLPTCSQENALLLGSPPPTDTPTPTPEPSDTPTNTPTPTPTPEPPEDDDEDEAGTPPVKTPLPPDVLPTPAGTPIAQADLTPPPTLPVAILPETGFKPSPLNSLWPLVALSVLGALIVWAVHRHRR